MKNTVLIKCLIIGLITYLSCSSLFAQYDVIVPASWPNLVGYWTFDNSANLTQATDGSNLTLNGVATSSSGPSSTDGAVCIGAGSNFKMQVPISANGGGIYVNEFTLVFDIYVDTLQRFVGDVAPWRTLFQTSNTNSNDADFWINPNGNIGVGSWGYSPRSIAPKQWYRLVISVDLGNKVSYYLDGHLIYSTTSNVILDGRFSLYTSSDPNPYMFLFSDDSGEDGPIFCAAAGIFNKPLSDSEVLTLGGYDRSNVQTSSCPVLKGFVSNSCAGAEGLNEYVLFTTGTQNYNLDSLYIQYSDPNFGWSMGFDYAGGTPSTIDCSSISCSGTSLQQFVADPDRVNYFNSITNANPGPNCAPLKNPPASGILPPNSIVMVFTGKCSNASCTGISPIDFSPWCSLGKDIYIISANSINTNGKMWNDSPGSGTTFITRFDGMNNTCMDYNITMDLGSSSGTTIGYSVTNINNGLVDGDGVKITSATTGTENVFNCFDYTILPIELLSFTSNYNQITNYIDLHWTSQNEKNFSHFIIEKASISSVNGKLDFIPIGEVSGSNIGTSIQSYNFTDTNPSIENYYRLQLVDNSGEIHYSSIISIENHTKNIEEQIKLYPIPANDRLTIQLPIDVEIIIHNIEGDKLFVVVPQSNNTEFSINTSNFPNGLYLMTFIFQEGIFHRRFIIQH